MKFVIYEPNGLSTEPEAGTVYVQLQPTGDNQGVELTAWGSDEPPGSAEPWYILRLKDSQVLLYNGLSDDLGFNLDDEGRIEVNFL